MTQEEIQKDELARQYGFESAEELREFIRQEIKQAFKEGILDRHMAESYGISRRGS